MSFQGLGENSLKLEQNCTEDLPNRMYFMLIWGAIKIENRENLGQSVPPIKKTDQNFQKTDQYRTLFKRNNRPIPDLSYLNTGPYETNNTPIPDLTMLMFL